MKYQNLIYYIPIISLLFTIQTIAQDIKPEILYVPENWKFERMDFPLGFAPEIEYEGFEELIFSPGMFDTEAIDYFSYIFTMSISNKKEISREELQKVLLSYYKGLSYSVAHSKELTIDTTKITASVDEVKNDIPNKWKFSAQVQFIDTFTDSRMIDLSIELDVKYDKSSGRLFVLAMASPAPQEAAVWEVLEKHRNKIIELNPQLQ